LKSSQKTEAMKSRDMKAQVKNAGSAAKKRAN
jgi:hypothetical protein